MHLPKGVLLIGGKSSRMGAPKHLLEIQGEPLGCRLCTQLQSVTGTPPLLLGEGKFWPGAEALEQIQDKEPGQGPLSALLGLYRAQPNTDFLILACDLPLMTQTALQWLLAQRQTTQAPLIWPRQPNREHGEPLASIYRASALNILERAWGQGTRGLIRAAPVTCRAQPVIPARLRHAFQGANDPITWSRLSE